MSSPTFPSTGPKPKFNPNAEYQAVQEQPVPKGNKPAFNPKATYEPVHEDNVPTVQQQQPQTQPAFKPMTDWLAPSSGGYQPIVAENAIPIDDHTKNTAQAADRVSRELETIDPHIGNLIYNNKKDIQGRIKSQELGINPKEAGPLNFQASALEKQPITEVKPEEIEEYKAGMNENVGMLRTALDQKVKDLTKSDPVKANQLKSDIYRLDAQERADNESKIAKNVEKLKNGDLEYDSKRGVLLKPEGFFGSLVTGFKQKNQLFKDYEFYKNTDNEAAIIKDLNDKLKAQDPDEAQVVPDGNVGEAGALLGGTPIKPVVGGVAAGAFTTPLGGATAAAGISAHEMYKLGYAAALPNNYAALKREHPEMPDYEAYQQAKALTEKQANVDAFVGAASGFIGVKAGLTPATSLLHKSVSSALRQLGKAGVERGLEGLAVGSAAGAGQVVKNLVAQNAGLNVDATEGVVDQFKGAMIGTMAMAIAAKSAHLLKPSTYNKLFHSLSKLPEETVNGELNKLQEVGYITPEEAQKTQTGIKGQAELDAAIPENTLETERLKIQAKIKQRTDLEAQLEKTDTAFHPEIKEKIKKLNEEIVSIFRGEDRGELQKFVDKEVKEGKVSGIAIGAMRNATEKELSGYMKDIAEQAANPATTQATIDTFGEAIVNKAKELHPDVKAPEPSRITVIQPGEIKQPETITISPREQPNEISSTDKVSVIMPKSKEDAVSQQITDGVDVHPQAGDGQAMGEGNAQPEVPAGQEGQPKEENITPNPQGQVGEPEKIGITHAQMDNISRELGLETYKESPETVAQWDIQAKERFAKDPEAMNKVIQKLRNGEGVDKVETRMMIMHMADLKAKYDANPTPELLNQIKRVKDLYNISGREKGKELVARKGSVPTEETLADFHLTDIDFNKGAPLTEEQAAKSTKEYNEIKAAKDALDKKMELVEAENAKLKAEKKIQELAKTIKKDAKKDYKSERQQILKDIGEKWRKSSKESLGSSVLPFAKELAAIAPDVMKLVGNVIADGFDKLPDIIKSVHNQIKEFIPEITEKNIHDIIAGEYTGKQTRSKLAEQLYNLRKEASLMNELDQLLNGSVPINKGKKIKRNQRIEELRSQIKELKDEMGLNERSMDEKLASLKGRYKTNIKELEDKIAKGDYGPDEKPEPIQLDKEGLDLRDEYLRLKDERAIRLLKQQYADRTTLEKNVARVSKAVRTGRQLQSGFFDVSYPFRQTIVGVARQLLALPFKRENGKLVYTGFKSQRELRQQFGKMYQAFGSEKNYRRAMADIKESTRFDVAQKSKLDIAEIDTPLERFKEEEAQQSYAEKIPVAKQAVRMSNRAATAIANKMKFDIFNQLVDGFEESGRTFENSPELYKEAAKYANQLVGRGFLGEKLEMASPLIGHVLYSLRLQASRLQLLTNFVNPKFYAKVPKEIRVEYFKDMAKFVLMGSAMLGLAKAAGLGVELDPRSSDFGSIRWGNTRFDIWGGFKQYVTLFARLLTASTKSPETGGVSRLKIPFSPGKPERGERTYGDVLLRFGRTKLSPEAGTLSDILIGETFDKKAVTARGEAINYIAPMIIGDVYDAWKDNGVLGAAFTYIAATHGIGTQSHIKNGDFDDLISGQNEESEKSSGKPTKAKPTKVTKTTKH